MIDFDFHTKCYSCGACQAVCCTNAITMSDNCLPTVGTSCVNCGLCERVCPHINAEKYSKQICGKGFVARNKNTDIRKDSSSGGVFKLLADEVVRRGWSVCGCIYDADMMPKHIISKTDADIRKMMGSKYVKSDMSEALLRMKELLKSGEGILFSGTPCQIAAVRNMFPNELYIIYVGVVCHGSIERDIWKAYLQEEQKRGIIKSVTMRDKSHGWLNYGLKFIFEDGSVHTTYRITNGYFLRAFTDGLLERDRCLDCEYKGDQIKADILLGDAWGMETECLGLNDQWGLSGVICMTNKGKALFESVKDDMDFVCVDLESLTSNNQRIISPAKADKRYKRFRKQFESNPEKIQELCERYEKQTVLNRVKAKLRSIT